MQVAAVCCARGFLWSAGRKQRNIITQEVAGPLQTASTLMRACKWSSARPACALNSVCLQSFCDAQPVELQLQAVIALVSGSEGGCPCPAWESSWGSLRGHSWCGAGPELSGRSAVRACPGGNSAVALEGARWGNREKLVGWASRGTFLLLVGRRRHYTACEGEGASKRAGPGAPVAAKPPPAPAARPGAAPPAAHTLRSAPPAPRSSCFPAPGRGGAGGHSPQQRSLSRCLPGAPRPLLPQPRARSARRRRPRRPLGKGFEQIRNLLLIMGNAFESVPNAT